MNSDDEIRALCQAATPGPWFVTESGQCCLGRCIEPDAVGVHDTSLPPSDARFIAAARSLVPSLLARVEAAEAARDEAVAKLCGSGYRGSSIECAMPRGHGDLHCNVTQRNRSGGILPGAIAWPNAADPVGLPTEPQED